MRTHTIRTLCAVAAGAAILPLGGLAGTPVAAASRACRTHPVIAYVVNQASGTVTPIRTATNTALKAIKVGKAPLAIAITPNGKTAYVINALSNTVTPIFTATGTAGRPIPAGESAGVIAITPNGRTAYVVNVGPDTVTPISTATNTAGKTIPVGSFPWDIAITPNSRTAYVANSGSGTVTPISTATNKAGKPIKIPHLTSISPESVPGQTLIVSTPNGKTVYVASQSAGTVTPISTAINTAGKPIRVGKDPFALGTLFDGSNITRLTVISSTAKYAGTNCVPPRRNLQARK